MFLSPGFPLLTWKYSGPRDGKSIRIHIDVLHHFNIFLHYIRNVSTMIQHHCFYYYY